ncbi:MAG: signal recognition particle protein, partial [candidate division Zixibacteria bacterium]|nr:signal recognition particle protein [candidate division Zixibacteria bacterium]
QRPQIISGSRRSRIARGSGNTIQDVNRLLKQFHQMQRMIKQMQAGKLKGLMPGAFPGI